MLFKSIFFCFFIVCCRAKQEGDDCVKDDRIGTCTIITKCRSVLDEIEKRRQPQICGYVGPEPVVCCFDHMPPIATTTKRSNILTTTYVPMMYDYMQLEEKYGKCAPISAAMTSEKTGQKAFDKCIDYQERYVYPCEESAALLKDLVRVNHCKHNVNELIVGGTKTHENEFPHMVLLGYGDTIEEAQWLCGGSIISERFVLTAGHCTEFVQLTNVTYVAVRVYSRKDTANTDNVYKVRRIIKHPDFKPPIKYNDIALLEMETPIKLSPYVVPACLDVGGADDSRVLATGWGATRSLGGTTDIMEKVLLHKFSTPECTNVFAGRRLMKKGFIPETQTCYGDSTKPRDTCQGDSGGPLQIKSKKVQCMYVIVGVTSAGAGCGHTSDPGLYTRVQHYVPWIESIVWPEA